MHRKYKLLAFLVLATSLAGCVAHYSPEHAGNPYGFFFGIWHGMIFPFSVIGKLISWIASFFGSSLLDSVTIFGQPNTGFWYYVGFALGIGSLGGGSSQAAS
jgi:hypothetical protein